LNPRKVLSGALCQHALHLFYRLRGPSGAVRSRQYIEKQWNFEACLPKNAIRGMIGRIFQVERIMTFPDRAVTVLFGQGRENDSLLLSLWREAPLTYSPTEDLDHNWNVDHYEIVLGRDSTGSLFKRAAQLVLTNQFYPPEVMQAVSDFSLENRKVKAGDRVLQRIRIFRLGRLPLAEVLTLNEVTQVIREERRAGFTYTTTLAHSEIGEWSPVVEWRENGEVVLVISVTSRCRPGASELSRRFTRRMQLRAHKLSIQSFRNQINGAAYPAKQAAFPADLLPVGLLAAAFFILLGAALGYNRRSE
jgi:uncharacterized protein (UPF0548 family)